MLDIKETDLYQIRPGPRRALPVTTDMHSTSKVDGET